MTVISSTNRRRGSRAGRGTWAIGGVVVVVLIIVERDGPFRHDLRSDAAAATSTANLLTNQALMRMPHEIDSKRQEPGHYDDATSTASRYTASAFLAVNERLLGPESYGNGCHQSCGCAETPIDCPRWYNTSDIVESARFGSAMEEVTTTTRQLQQSKTRAMDVCKNGNTHLLADVRKGGWCLHPDTDCTARECTIRHPHNITFPLPQQHVVAYRRIVTELAMMIDSSEEGISSISDFGAGVGQYKAKLLARYPSFSYAAYDGAGNIEAYTEEQVQYFDLTVPLSLPLSDWVICLEVGEHVPSKYEGMVIRNLHRHNKKGIILSWSVLGQKGLAHVNNHSPAYVLAVFQELGYTLDANLTERFRTPSQQNYWWFHESIVVLRRNSAAPFSGSMASFS